MLIIAALGIALRGSCIGACIPFVAGSLLSAVVPVAIAGIYPAELALAAVYGVLTALAFALYPLGRARGVSATRALPRRRSRRARLRPAARLSRGRRLALGVLAGAAPSASPTSRGSPRSSSARRPACVPAARVWSPCGVTALARQRAARPLHRRSGSRVGNIHRPGALTPAVVLSLGLGLTLLVALVLIDGNFRRELFGTIPATAPSFFMLDIQGERGRRASRPLSAAKARRAPTLEMQPMLRGRIVDAQRRPRRGGHSRPRSRAGCCSGDRGITYSATPPENSAITAGCMVAGGL